MTKHQFLRNARMMFPSFVTNHNSFDDSVKILKTKGMLVEGDAVKGAPDKEPTYDSPTPDAKTKYKKVEQSPEVDEQDGIYPATTLTDIPKEKMDKKVKDKSDGLEPIKNKDTKNEFKKVKIVKSKKKLAEAFNLEDEADDESDEKQSKTGLTYPIVVRKFYDIYRRNPRVTFKDIGDELGISAEEVERIIRRQPEVVNEQSFNRLRETIKNLVRKSLSEYEEGDESDEAPSASSVVDILINNMMDRIESNDLNLEFTGKDIQDTLNDFQNKIGHRYSDEQAEDIIEAVAIELKKQGYNIK
jgi:hypothetical protein